MNAQLYGIALLRVSSRPSEQAVKISFATPEKGDFVTVIHFPIGRPDGGISFGAIAAVQGNHVFYDASTEGGSSGGPVLDRDLRLVAMHVAGPVRSKDYLDPYEIYNSGLSRHAMLSAIRQSTSWEEIASYHRLAGDLERKPVSRSASVPSTAAVEPVLVRAAINLSVDPETLSKEDVSLLRDHVADPRARRWTLRPSERQNIIARVGSLDKLKAFRDTDAPKDAAERVIDEILNGAPYDLSGADEESLGWWIQASRWFDGVAPQLPRPDTISRALERHRVRSRLRQLAGSGFRGRAAEIERMNAWFTSPSGPLLLTGVGGIGKSALVSQFASQLPDDTLLLWLDFDAANLAPDDAPSVIPAIGKQAAIQLDGFEKPGVVEEDWGSSAHALGKELARHLGKRSTPLLVLDSFEAAQYVERYQELWPVLENIMKPLPQLRVIVTGRAPVPALALLEHPAVPLHLEGLDADTSREWLRDNGVTGEILDTVVALANGIPLILRLALRLVEAGGRVEDLPRDLPPEIVAGYLYGRILDRVQNPELKPVATAALVLRRFTVDMIDGVLAGLVELPSGDPSEWFAELSREMALVEGSDVLQLRPEVRAATLEMLERDDPDRVRTIDERAVQWYASQNIDSVETAAELVYHRLRLGDVAGAENAWRDGCGASLTYAEEEIRDPDARSWLSNRLGKSLPGGEPSDVWDADAVERILSARARGHARVVSKILKERPYRAETSALAFHEAFELRASGKRDAARKLLAHVSLLGV